MSSSHSPLTEYWQNISNYSSSKTKDDDMFMKRAYLKFVTVYLKIILLQI